MSPDLDRRSLLALVGSASVAGCSALATGEDCPSGTGASVTGWPLPARDPGNTNGAPGRPTLALGEATVDWTAEWRRRLGPPVVADGTVYLGSPRVDTDDPQGQEPPPALFAVDAASGDLRWERAVRYDPDPGQARLHRELAVGHDHLYAVQETLDESTPNRLLAVEADSGERTWVHEGVRRQNARSGPHFDAGVAFVGSETKLRALVPGDGSVCRSFHARGFPDRLFGGRSLTARPAVTGDRVFLVSLAEAGEGRGRWQYWLHGLDRGSGERLWTSPSFSTRQYVPQVVTADAERVYLPEANRVHAFTHDGDRLWDRPVRRTASESREPPVVARLTVADGRVFAHVIGRGDSPDGLSALAAGSGDGLWHRTGIGDPVVVGDAVYGWDGVRVGPEEYAAELHALDVATGETRSSFRFERMLQSPPRVAAGRLFAVTADYGEHPNRGRPTFRLHALS